ncbi:MAG: DUF2309 family protein, partial [Legionella sp.]
MMTIDDLKSAMNSAIERIPKQGPLEFFVHHNTIHHYQHLEFAEAVKKASSDYQCNAFMPEEFYWNEYSNRGIHKTDLYFEIDHYLERHQLRIPRPIFYNLLIPKQSYNRYLKPTENQSIRRYFIEKKDFFYKSAIQEKHGIDLDHFIAPAIYKFLAAYFDFGSAYWTLTDREQGIWSAFCALYANASVFDSSFLKILSKKIKKYRQLGALVALVELIKTLDLKKTDLNTYFFEIACRYKGWSGLIKSLEEHPEWIKKEHIKPNSMKFLAILILCETAAIKSITQHLPKVPRQETYFLHSERFIHHFFYEFCKSHERKEEFLEALPFLDDKSRQEILHKAFERTFYNGFLNTYATQAFRGSVSKCQYQVICCLDEREESLRRYLERDPACETFGHAGHFGLNIQFKGYFDKHQRALCPIQAKPEYLITESGNVANTVGLKSLFLWGELLWLSALSSKTILQGTFESFLGCFFKVIPFSLDIISPRLTSKLKHSFA